MHGCINTSRYVLGLLFGLFGLLLSGCQSERAPTVGIVGDTATPSITGTAFLSATPQPLVTLTDTDSTLVAPAAVPLPWPGQDVLLLCEEGGASRLWRYRPDDQTWNDESFAALHSPNFTPLALTAVDADNGVLVSGLYRENDTFRFQAHLWLAEQDRLVVNEPGEYQLMPSLSQSRRPEGQILYLTRNTGSGTTETTLYALDLEQCQADDCALRPVDSLPLWSPDQTWTLISNIADQTLFLGDAVGQAVEHIGPGVAPFWLDAESYGYLRPLAPTASDRLPATELVAASIDAPVGEVEVLLTADVLQELLDADPNWDRSSSTGLILANAGTAPRLPERVFVTAIEPQTEGLGRVLLFDLDTAKGKVRWILELETPATISLEFTRNGRYLVAADTIHLYLYELDTGQLVQYPQVSHIGFAAHDWSADEVWLLVLEGNRFTLAAPDHDYQQPFTLAGQSCLSGVWVNR